MENINKLYNYNKKNNIIIISKNLKDLKKYNELFDNIYFFLKPEIKNIKNIYFLLKKLEYKYNVNKNKINIIYLKRKIKNNIYYLIIKEIFMRYKIIYIK